jgi:hypothetical protein
MKANLWIRQALAMCLTVTVFVTYSMAAAGGSGKLAGEILISGTSASGSTPSAIVNGETVKSGRTIFSTSTVSTPEGVTATLKLGKAGIIELSPNTSVLVSFDEENVAGTINEGVVKVLSAQNGIAMTIPGGETLTLLAGETASAAGRAQVDDDNDGGAAWWGWALIFGGAAAGIIWAATRDSNKAELGGGGVVISPTF